MSAVRFRFSGKVCFAIRGHFNVSDHGDDEARPTHGIALSYCENGYAELPVSKMNYILSNVSVGSEGKEKLS